MTDFKIFYNEPNDDNYWEWLKLNPQGYVVNPKKNHKTNDFKYHRPDCIHIADTSDSFTFTTKGKRKICSNDLAEVLNELKKYKGYNGVFTACSSCRPDLK